MTQHLSKGPGAHPTNMVSMQVVRTLVDAVVKVGVAQSYFLRVAKLEASQLQAFDARLPRSKLYELFDLALELTGDPAFGLHSIEAMSSDALNPIAALIVHSATLRDAIASLQEFRAMLGNEASFHVHEEHGKVCIRTKRLDDEPLHVRRFMAEITVAGLFRIIERFRPEARLDAVAFDYAAPPYHREYARIFGGRARFEQPFSGLVFDSALLAAAAPHPDAELHQALSVFAQRRVARLTNHSPYAARVYEFLAWQRPPRDMTMPAVARSLGVSVRSLRRYLTAEGKSFSSIVDDAQAFIAKACLLDERRTIQDTSVELGFADHTGFYRAFKRWTGVTPAEYRRQHRPMSQAVDSAARTTDAPALGSPHFAGSERATAQG